MMIKKIPYISLLCFICLSFAGCETLFPSQTTAEKVILEPFEMKHLSHITDQELHQGMIAFQQSCARILKKSPTTPFGEQAHWGTYQEWQPICRDYMNAAPEETSIRSFIDEHFQLAAIQNGQTDTGLITGYYEPLLDAATTQSSEYTVPIRARPADLVMVSLGDFKTELRGQRIAGRVKDGALKPYEDRKAIESGKLPTHLDTPLYWARNAVDVFFLQIQGSGLLRLPDGQTVRVGYDGQNGHPYTAIGKELIKRGALTAENVSMDTIKEWLSAHPQDAQDVMHLNRSYVFFRKIDTDGAIGAEGVTLTPEHSIAVDHTHIPYGLPMLIETSDPALSKLLVAQDTGGAIKGVLRGDIFWGAGEKAAQMAGPLKSPAKFYVLLPKSVKIQ